VQLFAVSKYTAYAKYGATRVLCGVNPIDGHVLEPTGTFAADMRRLAQGIRIEIPCMDSASGRRTVRLKAYVIGCAADYPAAASLTPFMESTSAHRFCRQCNIDGRADGTPYSFLPSTSAGISSAGTPQAPREHDYSEIRRVIQTLILEKADGVNVKEKMKQVYSPCAVPQPRLARPLSPARAARTATCTG